MMAKRPVLLTLVYVVLLSLFAALATIISQALELPQIQTMLVQICSFHSLGDYGIRFVRAVDIRGALWFFPLALVEVLPLVVGIDTEISNAYLAPLIALMIVVSINEELYFRGLILRTLRVKGTGFALAISSVLFGLVHLGSMTAGKGVGHTLLLVAFSGLFGYICAEIAIITRSLMVPVIWHFSHNFLASITMEASPRLTILIVGIQCTILLTYGIYLRQKINGRLGYTEGEFRRTFA